MTFLKISNLSFMCDLSDHYVSFICLFFNVNIFTNFGDNLCLGKKKIRKSINFLKHTDRHKSERGRPFQFWEFLSSKMFNTTQNILQYHTRHSTSQKKHYLISHKTLYNITQNILQYHEKHTSIKTCFNITQNIIHNLKKQSSTPHKSFFKVPWHILRSHEKIFKTTQENVRSHITYMHFKSHKIFLQTFWIIQSQNVLQIAQHCLEDATKLSLRTFKTFLWEKSKQQTCISSRNNMESTKVLLIKPPRSRQLSMSLAGFGRDLGLAPTSSQ